MRALQLADGRMLSVRRWGRGADPIVIVHGLLDCAEGWDALATQLSAPCIAFDLPGFGHSDPAPKGSIPDYARDLAEGLRMLGVERFTLIGHSLGGGVAAALAELMADQVTSLLLLAPAGFGRIHLAEAASIPGVRNVVQAALPIMLSSRRAVGAAFSRVITNGGAAEHEVLDRITSHAADLVDGAREGTRAVVDAGRARDAFYRRRMRYDGPVVAVWGEHDRLVPVAHRHGLKRALPQARIHVWYGIGHHPLTERFDELLTIARAMGERPVRQPQRAARSKTALPAAAKRRAPPRAAR